MATTSELIKKELNLDKGSQEPDKLKVGNLGIEQVIKIAKTKEPDMLVNKFKSSMKNVIGSCKSMGVLIESKDPVEVIKEINEGIYDHVINEGKTEVNKERRTKLDSELKNIQEELSKKFKKVEKVEEKVEGEVVAEGAPAAAPDKKGAGKTAAPDKKIVGDKKAPEKKIESKKK